MARQILPIAGAIIGGIYGGPQGAQIGFAVGSLIGNAVDPIQVQGNKIGDNQLQTAAEGGTRAIVFGKGCIRATCLLERGNRIVKKQRQRSGKGGGPVTVNERVYWTFAIGLGEDLVGGAILRIWEGEKLVYDVTPGSVIPEETAEFAQKFRFYDGAEDQLPDPDLEAIHGVGNAPYYRGTAYVVFPNFDLTDYREAIPTYRWEVAKSVESPPALTFDVTTKVLFGVTGGGGFPSIYHSVSNTSRDVSDGIGRPYRFFALTQGVPQSFRAKMYSGPDQSGALLWDSHWRGDPSLQSAIDSALDAFAGGAFASWKEPIANSSIETTGDPDYPLAFVEVSDLGAALPVDMHDSSYDALQFNIDGTIQLSCGIQYIASTDIPIGAVEIAGFPGYYRGPGGELYKSSWDIYFNGSHKAVRPSGIPAPPEAVSGDKIALSQIVAAIHRRCGHSVSDYNVSELPELIVGVVFEASVTGAEAINSIIGGYFADPTDYDGKIHYIKRGKPVVRTLTYDDLIDEPETTQRQSPIEYPRKLHLFAQTSWTGYAATKSTSSRSSPDLNNVVGEVSVAIPVTFDGPDEPAQIAAKLHKINWTDAEGEIVWQVTDEHLDLVPTDCVGLSLRGRLTRARITGIEDDPGVRKLTLRVDRQSAYTSDVTGIPLPLPTPPQPSILSPTVNAYLDIPALQDADDAAAPVYYDAMTGQSDVWPGSVLQRSLDGGANYGNAASASVNAIMGLLQNAVVAASPYYTDSTNEVIVKLYMDDEIDSLTNQQFLSEQGAFALSWDDAGVRRWEIMQYRDAEEIADKTFKLTTLHRGRLNSTTAAHPVGSLFVLLDTAVRSVDAQSSWIDTDLTHRAVTNGLSPETATARTEPYTAQSQTEWPVAHVLLDHAGNDLHIDIVPRHRFGTSLNPIRSINWTGYRVIVTDGSNTAAVDTTADAHTFDVTGWASPITVTVAQLNRITGAGPTVTEAIP